VAPALFIMLAAERFIVRAISKMEYPMEYGREMTWMINCRKMRRKEGSSSNEKRGLYKKREGRM
jgi:hypothetical protein